MLASFMVVLALQAAAAAQPANAAAGSPPATAAKPADAKPPKPKLVCVEEQQMGSLFTKRVCATAEDWEKRRQRDQDAMTRSNGTSACGVGGGGGC